MFELFHYVLATNADIGIPMEYLMKAKKKKTIIIFDYKRIKVNPDSNWTEKKEEQNYL